MTEKERNLKKKYIKMLSEKFLESKDDKVLKEMIEQLAITLVETNSMKELINEQGLTTRDRYGCYVPNRLIPLYQKHKRICSDMLKDLYKITAISDDGAGDFLDVRFL